MADQVSFDVVPLVGIGPVRLGMTRQEVRSILPAPVSSFARWQAAPDSTDAFLSHAFQVDYDAAGEVDYIELSRRGPFDVFYKGINIFATEAGRLVDFVSLDAPYDADDPELGSSYVFPHLALSFWRESVPDEDSDDEASDDEASDDEASDDEASDENHQGQFFDTVGVGKAGYYDKSA